MTEARCSITRFEMKQWIHPKRGCRHSSKRPFDSFLWLTLCPVLATYCSVEANLAGTSRKSSSSPISTKYGDFLRPTENTEGSFNRTPLKYATTVLLGTDRRTKTPCPAYSTIELIAHCLMTWSLTCMRYCVPSEWSIALFLRAATRKGLSASAPRTCCPLPPGRR